MNDSGHETDDRLEALFFDNLDKANGELLAEVLVSSCNPLQM